MVVPLVPIVLIGGGVVSAVGGGVNLVRGSQKLRQARRQVEKDTRRYEGELRITEMAVDKTNRAVHAYGMQQESSLDAVVHRMADFLRRHEQAVAERASDLLDGVVVESERLEEYTGGRLTVEGLATSVVTTAAASAATYTGIPLAVSTYGSASTGTAIANLSGAAAQRATMAWLGGGAINAGGGGMVLGATALNAVTIGPSILVAGFILNGKGERALTEASRHRVSVDESINEQHQLRKRLEVVDQRISELHALVIDMTDRGVRALDELEVHEAFDASAHAEPFRRALAFAISLRDIVSTPILDSDGSITPETVRLLVTYRGMHD